MTDPHATSLTPNRIHSLPVLVHYHLPASQQSFSTLFSGAQQVYVHPSAGGEGEDAWGSIYLKTVIQGVLMASPELHPCHTTTTDLSIYILDPRETYLRKSRQTPFTGAQAAAGEVWTGKGLISWALDEPGEGKNLITGRLIRDSTFFVPPSNISPMEALARMGQTPSWGIEISVGLRSPNAPPPVASAVPMSIKMEPTHSSRSMATSDISSHVRGVMSSPVPPSLPSSSAFSGVSRQPAPSLPHRAPSRPPVNHHSASIPAHPLSPSRVVSVTPHTKARDAVKHSASRKRKNTVEPSHTQSRTRRTTARKSSRGKGNASSSESDGFPDNISARLYNNPESLTKEQAERLLESPAFLSMLSKLTGQPIVANNGVSVKREREDNVDESEEAKRRISSEGRASLSAKKEDDSVAPTPKCWNCGRTKSAVWRMKVMDDGNSVRVCNACGLYWNKMRAMRPPKLWEGVDEDVRTVKRSGDAERPASRIDQQAASSSSPAGFRRTLSAAVNQDAKRIAAMKPVGPLPSTLKQSFKPTPQTSPVRASTSHTVDKGKSAVRNAKWNSNTAGVAASSPGGWVEPMDPPPPPSDNFKSLPPTPKRSTTKVVQESPNTAIRRIMGNTQSLSLPLSDDATAVPDSSVDWGTDLSAFFDVEGFSLSTGDMNLPSDKSEGDDDAMSRLFRTSSAIMESSPSPFDFSQLPPSSPPAAMSDLPHSALLLSSPDMSPMDRLISPAKSAGKTYTPQSIPSSRPTPVISNSAPTPLTLSTKYLERIQEEDTELKTFLASHQFDSGAMEQLWRMTNSQENTPHGNMSSTTETEGMLGMTYGSEDLYAMLDKSFARI